MFYFEFSSLHIFSLLGSSVCFTAGAFSTTVKSCQPGLQGPTTNPGTTIIIIIIIIIIILTRPKPAFGRLGLGGSSGVKTLGEGKISKNVTNKQTDTSSLYIYHHHHHYVLHSKFNWRQ